MYKPNDVSTVSFFKREIRKGKKKEKQWSWYFCKIHELQTQPNLSPVQHPKPSPHPITLLPLFFPIPANQITKAHYPMQCILRRKTIPWSFTSLPVSTNSLTPPCTLTPPSGYSSPLTCSTDSISQPDWNPTRGLSVSHCVPRKIPRRTGVRFARIERRVGGVRARILGSLKWSESGAEKMPSLTSAWTRLLFGRLWGSGMLFSKTSPLSRMYLCSYSKFLFLF